MRPAELWSVDTKFVEIDVRNGLLGLALDAAGMRNYLAVGSQLRRVAKLQASVATLADRIVHSDERKIVLLNNADVLILSGTSAANLWRYRRVRHAQYVAWSPCLSWSVLFGMLGWLVRFLAGQYRCLKLVKCQHQGVSRYLLVSEVKRVKRCYHSALHFIPHRMGLSGLFRRFDKQDVKYAVLRWFESLPKIQPGEDIDLLISDESHQKVLQILESGPGIMSCDVYTQSGLPRTDYSQASYFPPHLAGRILENRVLYRNVCFVPDRRNHFHSLAYHAVYHKGARSGLAGAEQFKKRRQRANRNYAMTLRNMAKKLHIEVDVSLLGLHRYLTEQGWAPPSDLIGRLSAFAPRNRWLAWLAAQNRVSKIDNLTTFVVREEAYRRGFLPLIVSRIKDAGFQVLNVKTLSHDEIRLGAPQTRGGNWGPGPKDHQGGKPAAVLVAYDPRPMTPTRRQKKRFPRVTNARQFVKDEIRNEINRQLPVQEQVNALHSTDYGSEALHFVRVFAPELEQELISKIGHSLLNRRQAT